MFASLNQPSNFESLFSAPAFDEPEKPSFAFFFEPEFELQPQWPEQKPLSIHEPSGDASTDLSHSLRQQMCETLSISADSGEDNKDYNAVVDEIIQISYSMKRGDDRPEEAPQKDELIRNRRKLKKREIAFLQKEFDMNPDWDKAYTTKLAAEIGLSYYKVYKWNWDMKKKSAKSGLGKRSRVDDFSRQLKRAKLE